MKPPDEFELSLPLLCRPLVRGVAVPGGDKAMLWGPPGDDVPGDLEYGEAYLCDEAATAAAAAEKGVAVFLVGEVIVGMS
jgi:hypothetical protein